MGNFGLSCYGLIRLTGDFDVSFKECSLPRKEPQELCGVVGIGISAERILIQMVFQHYLSFLFIYIFVIKFKYLKKFWMQLDSNKILPRINSD